MLSCFVKNAPRFSRRSFDPKNVKKFIPSLYIDRDVIEVKEGKNQVGQSKGFGFVEFAHHTHALAVLKELNNSVEYSKEFVMHGSKVAEMKRRPGASVTGDKADFIGEKGEIKQPRLIVEFTVENMAKSKLQQERLAKKKSNVVVQKKNARDEKVRREGRRSTHTHTITHSKSPTQKEKAKDNGGKGEEKKKSRGALQREKKRKKREGGEEEEKEGKWKGKNVEDVENGEKKRKVEKKKEEQKEKEKEKEKEAPSEIVNVKAAKTPPSKRKKQLMADEKDFSKLVNKYFEKSAAGEGGEGEGAGE